jgi:hypothetical protein
MFVFFKRKSAKVPAPQGEKTMCSKKASEFIIA